MGYPFYTLVIPVDVAYGSDTKKVCDILGRTAREHAMTLNEPKLRVLLLMFGESALNFKVRCLVREVGDRITANHEMHMAIEQALRGSRSKIPFPQRDLPIRTMPIRR